MQFCFLTCWSLFIQVQYSATFTWKTITNCLILFVWRCIAYCKGLCFSAVFLNLFLPQHPFWSDLSSPAPPIVGFFFFFFWKGFTFSDAGSDGTQPASCVDIQNRQSTYSCRCPMYGACQNDVFCGLFCSTTLAIWCRSKAPFVHERLKTPNTSPQAVEPDPWWSGQAHPHWPSACPRNESMEIRWTLQVFRALFKVSPLSCTNIQFS